MLASALSVATLSAQDAPVAPVASVAPVALAPVQADVICIEESDKTTRVLLVGPGGVSERVLDGFAETDLPVAEFVPLRSLQGRALAAAAGNRAVVRPDGQDTLFTYAGGTMTKLLEDDEVSEGTRLAVGSDGTVALLLAKHIVKFNVREDGVSRTRIELPFAPRDIAFDRHGLVMVSEKGTLVRLDAAVRGFSDVDARFAEVVTGVSAVGEYSGLLYSTFGERMLIATGRDFASWAIAPVGPSISSGRPGMTRNQMFLHDQAAGVVRRRERLVPATVVFRDDEPRNLSALAETYKVLEDGGLLVTEVVKAKPSRSLETFLFDRGVVIPAQAVRADDELAKDPAGTKFYELLSSWNNKKYPVDVLGRPVSDHDAYVLPVVNRRQTETLAKVKLGGTRTVEDVLGERLSGGSSRWTSSRLASINPKYSQTVEGYFNRLGYVLATPPRPSFGPGTTFWTEDGTEQVDLSCGRAVDFPTSAVPLQPPPMTLETKALASLVPRVGRGDVKAIARFGVERAEVRYEGVTVEKLDDSVKLPRYVSYFDTCFKDARDDALVVREAVRAARVLVRFFDVKGTRICPTTDAEVAQLGLAGRLTPGDEWCLAVEPDKPLYVAYRAEKWTTSRPEPRGATFIADVSEIKSGTRQDFLAARFEEVTLPIDRWQIIVPATVSTMANEASPLRQLQKKFAVDVRSNVPLTSSAFSFAQDEPASPVVIDETVAITITEDQRKGIEFVPNAAGATNRPIIGIVETDESVEYGHPEFFNASGTIWQSINEFGEAGPRTVDPLTVAEVHFRQRDVPEAEHGTHVAGIIAAQREAPLSGLFRNARLAVIDRHGTAPEIVAGLKNAYKARARVFGFSLGFDTIPANHIDIKDLRAHFAENDFHALYVIAAGNDGNDLREPKTDPPFPYAPIAWVSPQDSGWTSILADRMLGVGAYDASGLYEHSNYSKAHVQLLAPGRDVFSTAKNGDYGKASGTSQAVPFVVATAAMLFERLSFPERVKARLIYTSEPVPETLDDKVWGGLLNVRRATSHLEQNVLKIHGRLETLHIDTTARAVNVKVKDLKINAPIPGDAIATASAKVVKLSDILSITNRKDGTRIVYLDEGLIRIARSSGIEGNVPCDLLMQLNEGVWGSPTQSIEDRCKQGLRWSQLSEYVASIQTLPKQFRFTNR